MTARRPHRGSRRVRCCRCGCVGPSRPGHGRSRPGTPRSRSRRRRRGCRPLRPPPSSREHDGLAERASATGVGDGLAVAVVPTEVLVDGDDVDDLAEGVVDVVVDAAGRQGQQRGAHEPGRVEPTGVVDERAEEGVALGSRQRLVRDRPEDHRRAAAVADDELVELVAGIRRARPAGRRRCPSRRGARPRRADRGGRRPAPCASSCW